MKNYWRPQYEGPLNAGDVAPTWAWVHKGLVYAGFNMGHTFVDMTGKLMLPTITGTVTQVTDGMAGVGLKASTDSSGLAYGVAPTTHWVPQPSATNPLSVFVLLKAAASISGNDAWVCKGRAGSNGWIFKGSGTTVNLVKCGVADQFSNNNAINTGIPSLIGATVGASNVTKYYLDGKLFQTMSNTSAFGSGAASEGDILVSRNTVGTAQEAANNSEVYAIWIWNVLLTDAQIQQFSADPFAAFSRANRRAYKAPAGGGGGATAFPWHYYQQLRAA